MKIRTMLGLFCLIIFSFGCVPVSSISTVKLTETPAPTATTLATPTIAVSSTPEPSATATEVIDPEAGPKPVDATGFDNDLDRWIKSDANGITMFAVNELGPISGNILRITQQTP